MQAQEEAVREFCEEESIEFDDQGEDNFNILDLETADVRQECLAGCGVCQSPYPAHQVCHPLTRERGALRPFKSLNCELSTTRLASFTF